MWQGIVDFINEYPLLFWFILWLIDAGIVCVYLLICKRKTDVERATEDTEQEQYLKEYCENKTKERRK
ncbi:MAG: hypothetical protein IJV71_12050 [Lachnospiraceae bacterium]|nr:hypothetical protein [Lachnospiraceae bacterium]